MSEAQEPLYMSPSEAKLWQAMLTIAQELSVARDRIDLLERALAAKGVLEPGELESLPLSDGAVAARSATRQDMVERIVRPLREA